jgi:hypothetical protein
MRNTDEGNDMTISKGVAFDTPYEKGCVALEAPNSHGSFLALDSDGIECDFHVAMVVERTPDDDDPRGRVQ